MVWWLGVFKRRSVRDQDLRGQDSTGPDYLVALVPHRSCRVAHLPKLRRGSQRLAGRLRLRESNLDHNSECLEAEQMEEADAR